MVGVHGHQVLPPVANKDRPLVLDHPASHGGKCPVRELRSSSAYVSYFQLVLLRMDVRVDGKYEAELSQSISPLMPRTAIS